jgi:ComF family protein
MLKAVQNSLLSLIYPRECRICSGPVNETENGSACSDCWTKTRIFQGSETLCNKCGAFFGDTADSVAVKCHACNDHSYDRATAVGIYENALAASIIALKTSPCLPDRIVRAIDGCTKRPGVHQADVLIPVPLSKKRRLERGFNQAEVIAAIIKRITGTPIDSGSLERKLHTTIHRIGMDEKARDLTVRGAFNMTRPKLVSGKNVLLVDDVFTSGATASHCARILKKHGAATVNVFTLARAVVETR